MCCNRSAQRICKHGTAAPGTPLGRGVAAPVPLQKGAATACLHVVWLMHKPFDASLYTSARVPRMADVLSARSVWLMHELLDASLDTSAPTFTRPEALYSW